MLTGQDLLRAVDAGIDSQEYKQWPNFNGGHLDRTAHVTASEVGKCARMVKLDKEAMRENGYDPAAGTKYWGKDDWGFWERGHTIEAWFVNLLQAGFNREDYTLMYTGEDQISFTYGVQSGTPDGVFVGETDFYILEVKSIDPRTNTSRLPKLLHRDQVVQNCDLVAEALDLSPAGGLLIYIDASNFKKRHAFMIDYNDDHADRLESRAQLIMDTPAEDLKPEGLYNASNDCEFCRHTAKCSAMIRKENNGENYDKDLEETRGKLFG